MTLLRELRYKLTEIYSRWSTLLSILLKFALALAVFLSLRRVIGGEGLFANTFLILILALMCSIMPLSALPVFGGVMIVGLAWQLGYDAAGISAVVLLMLLVLFLRFAPESGLIIVFVPFAMFFGVPQVVAICAALKQKMPAILPTLSGVVIYYLLMTLHSCGALSSGSASADIMARLESLAGGVFARPEMILNMIILCGVFVLVHAIRSLPIRDSYLVAICCGAAFYSIMMPVGGSIAGVPVATAAMLLSAVTSVAASLVFVFFIYDVNYRATEYLQFEDDEYYYYVKAMPKNIVKPMLDEGEGRLPEEDKEVDA